jgi:hypothetical protein
VSNVPDKFTSLILNQFEKLDAQREALDNSFHELILKNFKIHYLLEVTGRADEMLSSKHMIDDPVYRIHEGEESILLNGKEEVTAFYHAMRDNGDNVLWLPEYDLQVSDWGFSGEVILVGFVTGPRLSDFQRRFVASYDPETTYLLTRRMAFNFPSAPDGRLVGEFVYTDPSHIIVEAVAPEDVITPAQMTELLTPMLEAELASH